MAYYRTSFRAAAACIVYVALMRSASGSGWNLQVLLAEYPAGGRDAGVDELTQPLSEMAALSYVSTAGSYYRPEAAGRAPAGWRRALTVDPGLDVGYGLRAIVFVEDEGSHTVVSFRGTDLNLTTSGGRADVCMDYLAAGAELPEYCDDFPPDDIDYIHALKKIVALPECRRPGQRVLFTGHSLGCTLAVIAQALLQGSKTACFSQAAISDQYWKDRHLGVSAKVVDDAASLQGPMEVDIGNVVVLSDTQDPVALMSLQRRELHGKWACWWRSKESPACTQCLRGESIPAASAASALRTSAIPAPVGPLPPSDPGSKACDDCFAEKHTFRNYLDIINHDADASYGCRAITAEEPGTLTWKGLNVGSEAGGHAELH